MTSLKEEGREGRRRKGERRKGERGREEKWRAGERGERVTVSILK